MNRQKGTDEYYPVRNSIKDQIWGCLFGGAIGDAMGGLSEGKHPPILFSDNTPWYLLVSV